MSDERQQLLRFQNALRSEAHRLRRWPQLTAQQVFNALSESDAGCAAALEPQVATRATKNRWLRRLPRASAVRPRLALDEDVMQAELQSSLDRLMTLHPSGWRLISPA